ncbi:MAG: hypothetical protein ACD_19C00425G0002 [uncultured bacterium]|nr:MAG: hypothetical protein ACD_19C00425G0002 [uncultured bacterium]
MDLIKQNQKYILIIFSIGFLLFLFSLGNKFVWDDEEQIVNNTLIHSISNLPLFFSGGAFNSGGTGGLLGIYYKPMMTLSFSILHNIFGSRPFFFHLTSVFLHISSSVIVFLIFKSFFRDKRSLLLSLIFLVHPLYSEVVFYVANFQDVLFFFFGSLALLFSIQSKNKFLVTILLLLSLLSKETGIIFVLAVLFYKYWISSLLSLSIYAVMRLGIAKIGFDAHQISTIASLNLWQRLLNVPKIAFYYVQNLFVPTNLVPNQHWVITNVNFYNFWMPLLAVILFFAILIYFTFQKNKNYYLFLAIFILSFAMHMQIFPLDVTLSGRWFYLPIFGLLGMIGFFKPKLNIKYLESILYIIIISLSLITFRRSFDWKNGLTLYSHDAKIITDDFNLNNNLGVELFRIGKFKEAKINFQKSVDIAPYWWTNWNNLGAIVEREGDLETAATYYKKAIDNGNYYLAYENYALILIKQEKYGEAEKFIKDSTIFFPQNQRLIQYLQYIKQQTQTTPETEAKK